MADLTLTKTTREVADSGDYPTLGFLPKSSLGRLFFGWAVLNVVLSLLPVFDVFGNDATPGPLGMPLTVFYSYIVFSLNCFMGLAYALTRGRAWIAMEESHGAEDRA